MKIEQINVILPFVILVFSLWGCGDRAPDARNNSMITSDHMKDARPADNSNFIKVEVCGTVRNTKKDGWGVVRDSVHEPINIESINTASGSIIINFPFKAEKIHTFIVCPDERLAWRGYFVGSSVSQKSASIILSRIKNGKAELVRPEDLDEPFSNIWIYGLFSLQQKDTRIVQ